MNHEIKIQRESPPPYWAVAAQEDGVYVRNLQNSRWYIATVDGQLVGFGATAHPWPNHTRLYSIWVRPERRSCGIGSDLVRYQIASTDTDMYSLYTSIPDFFRPFGFVIYEEYQDSVHMRRTETE